MNVEKPVEHDPDFKIGEYILTAESGIDMEFIKALLDDELEVKVIKEMAPDRDGLIRKVRISIS